MKLEELLDALTEQNLHTERVVVEAIASGRADFMERACEIWEEHLALGYLSEENDKRRRKLDIDIYKHNYGGE